MARYKNGRPLANFECGAFNHSATSPGATQAIHAVVGACSRRGWRARQGGRTRFPFLGKAWTGALKWHT